MSAGVNLAGPEQRDATLALVEKCHEEIGIASDADHRAATIDPLLDGSPLGAIWLMGPIRAPMGYVVVTFTWSLTEGGMVGWVREIYTRPNVRKRGIGTETLHAVAVALRQAGVKALQVDLVDDTPQGRFWHRAGFTTASTHHVLTDRL